MRTQNASTDTRPQDDRRVGDRWIMFADAGEAQTFRVMDLISFTLHRVGRQKPFDGEIRLQSQQPAADRAGLLIAMQDVPMPPDKACRSP